MDIIPINQLKPNQIAIVAEIRLEKSTLIKLAGMGLIVGSKIEVISKNKYTSLLALGPTRLAINKKIAEQIFVRKKTPIR